MGHSENDLCALPLQCSPSPVLYDRSEYWLHLLSWTGKRGQTLGPVETALYLGTNWNFSWGLKNYPVTNAILLYPY